MWEIAMLSRSCHKTVISLKISARTTCANSRPNSTMRTLCSLRVDFIVDFKARVYGATESIERGSASNETAACVLVSELSTHASRTRNGGGSRKIRHGMTNNRNWNYFCSRECSKSLYTRQTHNLHIHLYHIDFWFFFKFVLSRITEFTRVITRYYEKFLWNY